MSIARGDSRYLDHPVFKALRRGPKFQGLQKKTASAPSIAGRGQLQFNSSERSFSPSAEENVPDFPSANDGGKHKSRLRFARLDLPNQTGRLSSNYGFRFCRHASPLVTQRPSIGNKISGDR